MTSDLLLPPAAAPDGAAPAAWRAGLARWLLAAAHRLLASHAATMRTPRIAGPVPGRHAVRHPGTVVVTRGRLWVTVDGDLRDHAVPAGASLDLPAGSTAWIGSLDDGASADWHWTDRPRPAPFAPAHPTIR